MSRLYDKPIRVADNHLFYEGTAFFKQKTVHIFESKAHGFGPYLHDVTYDESVHFTTFKGDFRDERRREKIRLLFDELVLGANPMALEKRAAELGLVCEKGGNAPVILDD